MKDPILEEIKALREDLETQTAINIVEGINTIETLALFGHWIRKRRAPNAKELQALEQTARARWADQVRHMIAIAKKEPGGLDRSLSQMLPALATKPGSRKKSRKR